MLGNNNNRHIPNNTQNKKFKAYKICAGENCGDEGTNLLKIILMRKPGWFCDACAEEMKKSGMVDYSVIVARIRVFGNCSSILS